MHHNPCNCRRCNPRELIVTKRDRLSRMIQLAISLKRPEDEIYHLTLQLAAIGNDFLSMEEIMHVPK